MVRLRDVKRKVPVSVRLDPQVLDWLRGKGEGHLTRINDILSNLMEAERRTGWGDKQGIVSRAQWEHNECMATCEQPIPTIPVSLMAEVERVRACRSGRSARCWRRPWTVILKTSSGTASRPIGVKGRAHAA